MVYPKDEEQFIIMIKSLTEFINWLCLLAVLFAGLHEDCIHQSLRCFCPTKQKLSNFTTILESDQLVRVSGNNNLDLNAP